MVANWNSPECRYLTGFHPQVDKIGRENAVRAMATTSLLGYHAPSFTYGTDLILPADVNNQLRRILLSAAAAEDHGTQDDEDEIEFEVIREYMMAMSSSYDLHTKSFIPEVRFCRGIFSIREHIDFFFFLGH